MSAVLKPQETRFEALTPARLEQLMAIEQQAYSHPWTRGNFQDALDSGYRACALLAGDELLGYYVAMRVLDEAHLLNLTVGPKHQRQGWSRVLMDDLNAWARSESVQSLWLEVRLSNERAIGVYAAHGYRRIGLRKNYYPAGHGLREDAVVMTLRLDPAQGHAP